jgi:hypothetical protein
MAMKSVLLGRYKRMTPTLPSVACARVWCIITRFSLRPRNKVINVLEYANAMKFLVSEFVTVFLDLLNINT